MRRLRRWGVVVASLFVAGSALAGVSFDIEYAVGQFGIGKEQFNGPVDVVEDKDENIYVVDQGNNRIEVLNRRGQFVREWGGRGFTPGRFDTPVAITIDPATGSLFVVDLLNHRIQKFDPNGKFLMAIGRLGSSTGEFNKPMDVALDRNGNIYVADSGNNRIQKFDPSGKFLAEWGRYARFGKGVEINNPVSIAYTDEGYGYLYVLDAPECRVQKFELDGTLVGVWPMHRKGEGALCGPSHIRVEPRRYTVYIADTENDRVILFTKDGDPLGDLREGRARFKKPRGLFLNVLWFNETVIVADTGNNLIQKFRRTN